MTMYRPTTKLTAEQDGWLINLVHEGVLELVTEPLYRRQCADGAACNDGLSAPYPHIAACFVGVSEENNDE